MKLVLSAFLIVLAVSGSATSQWSDVVSYLPTCFTGLPFKLPLTTSQNNSYVVKSTNLPTFATIDKSGSIAGTTNSTGSFAIKVLISTPDNSSSITKQYILSVTDLSSADSSQLWSTSTNNYYTRNVTNPLTVTANANSSLIVNSGDKFSYTFKAKNQVGNVVFAFLNLPAGITGDNKAGTISGSFQAAGIYNLGIETADQAGNTAQGYLTITVKGASSGSSNGNAPSSGGSVSILNQATINNSVPFVYDLSQVQAQQVAADKLLFNALALVNAAKADVAAKQNTYDSLSVQLSAAEATADQAATDAANANSARQMAALRLATTNKALNDAEDALNLALLSQLGGQDALNKANDTLNAAQTAFNTANTTLAAANKLVLDDTADVNNKNNTLIQAGTTLANAKADFTTADNVLTAAKNALNGALAAQVAAQAAVTKAQNDLTLAQKAYNIANAELTEALNALAAAETARQAALGVQQGAILNNQNATTSLGSLEWDLTQAIAGLNVAQAAKDAADRTSALVLANGTPLQTTINTNATFSSCNDTSLPTYQGSVSVTQVKGDTSLTSTGSTLVCGPCTKGKQNVAAGNTISVKGFININSNSIEAIEIKVVTTVK